MQNNSCLATSLSDEVIAVWRIKLADFLAKDSCLPKCLRLLSADEEAKAKRFHFKHDQQAYIIFHGMLREILANYLHVDHPRNLKFHVTEKGKPFLPDFPELTFNLSHTKHYALIAVAKNTKYLGIDIESNARETGFLPLAQRFFHPDEVAQLVSAPEEQQQMIFFQFWTAKEAFVKAVGEGVSFGLDNFSVALPGQVSAAPQVTWVKNKRLNEIKHWQITYLNSPKGHTACLVYHGAAQTICYQDYFEFYALRNVF